jgi:RHS repeat-associated protein
LTAAETIGGRRVEYTYEDELLTGVKDALGNVVSYEYNSDNRLVRSTDAAGRQTVVSYASSGKVASVVDEDGVGHFFSYSYDKNKEEYYAQIETTSGMVREIWYNSDGETKRVDVNGRTIKKITQDGRNLTIKDEKGNITEKEYDELENLTRIVYPDDSEVLFEYDLDFNKVSRVEDALGRVTEYSYDDVGNLIQKTDAKGMTEERVTTYTYDDEGQLLSAVIEGDDPVETAFTYDADGNLETMTDPMGNVTQFLEYDAMGNLLRMSDARGEIWLFEYDDTGRLVAQTDPLNNTTAYEYDGANNRTAVINAQLKRFEFEYDDHNNLIRAVDPQDKYIELTYNTDNLPTEVVDQEGVSSAIEYDNEGRITSRIDGAGNETQYLYSESTDTHEPSTYPIEIVYPTFSRQFTYDRRGRVVEETDVLEAETLTRTYEYDEVGNLVASTDEEGEVTSYTYDALNRLVSSVNANGDETNRTYDSRGNLTSIQDANDGNTFYIYDKNNRMTRLIRPMLQETAYEYDAVGNRTAVVDTKGQRIEYVYDGANRLTTVTYFDADDLVNPVKTVVFSYDELGNLTAYDDGTTSGAYTYDDLSRKIAESIDYGDFTLEYGYSYYANGLKQSFTGPGGTEIGYTYDENNRLTGIGIPDQGEVGYTYDAASWNSPASRILPGGATTDYSYDPLMRIESIVATDPGNNTLMSREYTYSPVGDITSKATEHGDYTYQYDVLGRLTTALNPTLADEMYTYDALGNRTSDVKVTGDLAYNANNELTGFSDTTFDYDGNGNMISRDEAGTVTEYVYDIEDRMVQVEVDDGVVAEYYYDPFGRRLWKKVDGTRTYFLYSDEGLIGEYDESGTETKAYGWVPDSVWSTDPLFVREAGVYYYYENDAQGTPQKIIQENGNVVWSARYDSFGNCVIDTETIKSNLRLGGQYFDAETGLYYNWNRYYDPTLGRYLRTDPLGDGLNLYAYCFNDPISLIDPAGLCAIKSGLDTLGGWLGTGLGEDSAMWYAEKFNETGSWYYAVGGCFASLWTPDTWVDTTVTLVSAGMLSAEIQTARTSAEATQIAVRAAVEEATGVPIPSSPRAFASKSTKPRFIADEAGNIVDTHATPPGRYIQPDKSATDILQDASHPGLDDFTSRTHTHDATVHVNPNDPTKGTTKLSEHPRSVTTEEVKNIMDGTATKSTSRGH